MTDEYMGANMRPYQSVTQKFMGLMNKWQSMLWQITPLNRVGAFYTEIYQSEQLPQTSTRPTIRLTRPHPKNLEPITEQQKIMDLSG